MFRVRVEFGRQTLGEQEFDQEIVTIGRDAGCDLVVDNARASRHHAAIERTHRGYVLSDLSSQNGTYVDGKRVRRHRLEDADCFVIGRYAFTFEELAPHHTDQADLLFPSEDDQPRSEEPESPSQDGERCAEEAEPEAPRRTATDLKTLLRRVREHKPTQLVQLAPPALRRTLPLAGHYALIGSGPGCDIRVGGWFVPRKAALIVRTGSGHRAIALSRRFRVNDGSAEDVRLDDGDLLTVGPNRFRYCRS